MRMSAVPKITETKSWWRSPASLEQALEDFLEIFNHHPVPCLFLPSLSDIATRLDCPPLLLYEALNRLRAKGYDYFMLDLNSSITIWLPEKLAEWTDSGGGSRGAL